MSLSHAYIYTGGFYEEKVFYAFEFAKELCPDTPFDIISVSNEYYDIKTSGEKLSVDAVRSMISDAFVRPYGKYKVFIISNAEELNHNCQNAILKLLEEPPSYCVFILIADNCLSLLDTIVSRCTVKTFLIKSFDEIYGILQNDYNCSDRDRLKVISSICKGNLSKARQMFESDFYDFYSEVNTVFNGLFKSDSAYLYRAVDFFNINKDRVQQVLDIFSYLLSEKIASENFFKMNTKSKKSIVDFLRDVYFCKYNLEKNTNFNISIVNLLVENWGEIKKCK